MSTTSSCIINLSTIKEFNELLYNNNNAVTNLLKINKIECKISDNQIYKVISYNKNMLNKDLFASYGLCRSVIANVNNKVISFAPPKSITSEEFISKYPIKNENIVAEEFIEGTMINVFWNDQIGTTGGWEFATKNTVGATSIFYKTQKSKTFRMMFEEALQESKLNIDSLNRDYCFSFVLQHPENRIVIPFKTPQLYLIAMYRIDNSDSQNILVHKCNVNSYERSRLDYTSISYPQVYSWNNYAELIEKYASLNTSYDVLGVILYNTQTGERTKIRNPVYEEVKKLRGNQPKLQYQYLSLRKEGQVKDYLRYYPENKNEFTKFRNQIHVFTNTLFINYVSCYIKKEKPLLEFAEQYRTHMFNIHQIYVNELKENKLFVTNQTVINYVNNLHPSLLMHCLNFDMKQLTK